MQNKTRLELADYEAENLAKLQKVLSRKWEFVFLQAEAQSKVDKKRDRMERKILDSQERAFWDVHRPMVVTKLYLNRYLRSTIVLISLDFFIIAWYYYNNRNRLQKTKAIQRYNYFTEWRH